MRRVITAFPTNLSSDLGLRFTTEKELFRRSLGRAPGIETALSLATKSLGQRKKSAGLSEAAAAEAGPEGWGRRGGGGRRSAPLQLGFMSRQAKDDFLRHYTVSDPRTHPKGYTEYKVTAQVRWGPAHTLPF